MTTPITTTTQLEALPEKTPIRDQFGDVGIVQAGKVHYPETAPQTFERAVKKYGPLTVLPVKDEPAAVPTSTVHYSRDLGRAPIVNPAPEGWDERDWHTSGVGDTGTSHVRVGRPYVVACQWCPETFMAETAAGALVMFRAHESLMLGYRTEGERG